MISAVPRLLRDLAEPEPFGRVGNLINIWKRFVPCTGSFGAGGIDHADLVVDGEAHLEEGVASVLRLIEQMNSSIL